MPRTQKNPRPRPRTALPKTDPLEAKDRYARGQGLRAQVQVFSKKKGDQNFFSGDLQKKDLRKFTARFLVFSNEILMIQKIVLSLAEDRAIFEDLYASRPRPRTWKCVLEDSTSNTHSKLDLKSLVPFIDVLLVMTNNIITLRAYDIELRLKLRSINMNCKIFFKFQIRKLIITSQL